MGACFNAVVFEVADMTEVQRRWVEAVQDSLYESGHSYSGEIGMLGPDIQWRTAKFPDARSAEQQIMDKHQKWEPPLAYEYQGEGGHGWVVGGWCSS